MSRAGLCTSVFDDGPESGRAMSVSPPPERVAFTAPPSDDTEDVVYIRDGYRDGVWHYRLAASFDPQRYAERAEEVR